VTPTDPIAFYQGCCWASGETPAEAAAECERRIDEEWCEPGAPGVGPRHVVRAIPGPYTRPPALRDRVGDDPSSNVYLSPEGDWLDETGEPPCFPAGTRIATEGGSRVIESIAEGERILGGDGRLAVVRRVKVREAARLLELVFDGGRLRVTEEHPVASGKAWRAAGELEVGDPLATRGGERRVNEVHVLPGATVYTLRVAAPHTYFADGVLVHNY